MPSTCTIYRESDANFTVIAESKAGRGYRVRSWFKGHDPHSESARTAEEALTAAHSLWNSFQKGLLDNPVAHPATLQSAVDRFVSRPDLRPKTRFGYESILKRVLAAVGADRRPRSIGERDLKLWLEGLTCSDVSKQTYLRTVKVLFRWTLQQGWIDSDPAANLKVKARPHMRSWMLHDDWTSFLAACEPAHRIRAGFALETGLRLGEICHSTWAWIHGSSGRKAIRIAEDPSTGFVPKWGRARAVPLSAKAMEFLDEAREKWGSDGFLFSSAFIKSPNCARRTSEACRKAGVAEVDFHGLRRSAGARWLELGIALHDVSRLLGHQEISTTIRSYAGISDAHLATCMDRVDAARAQRPVPVGGPQQPW